MNRPLTPGLLVLLLLGVTLVAGPVPPAGRAWAAASLRPPPPAPQVETAPRRARLRVGWSAAANGNSGRQECLQQLVDALDP